MTLYRDHRGSLVESMKTVRHVHSLQDVRTHLESDWLSEVGEITIIPYGYDKRIEWDTWIVCVDGNAVGMTNGELK